jgi:chromosome segregation ATPase
MTKPSIETRSGRIYISIPLALKDELKSAFRSAEWHSFEKKWSVAASAKKRLEAFVDTADAAGAFLTAEEHDARDMSEAETERLRERMRDITARLESAVAQKASLDDAAAERAALIAMIDKKSAELAAAAAEVEAARETEKREIDKIENIVASLIDLSDVKSAVYAIVREAKSSSRRGRELFDEKASIISDALETLEESGITSETMRAICDTHYNRAHKDIREISAPLRFELID